MKENEDFCFTRDIIIQTSSDRRVNSSASLFSALLAAKKMKNQSSHLGSLHLALWSFDNSCSMQFDLIRELAVVAGKGPNALSFVYDVSGGLGGGRWSPIPSPLPGRLLFARLLPVGGDLFYLGGDGSGEPYPGFQDRQRRALRMAQGQEASDMGWEVYTEVRLLDSKWKKNLMVCTKFS